MGFLVCVARPISAQKEGVWDITIETRGFHISIVDHYSLTYPLVGMVFPDIKRIAGVGHRLEDGW